MTDQIQIKTDTSELSVHSLNKDQQKLLDSIVLEVKSKLETRPKIVVFGKECHQNRNVGFFSNDSIGYRYSRQMMDSQPLTETLVRLLEMVNTKYSADFNGILINEYIDGNDSIGAHSDDETGLSKNAGIVAISYGSTRKFRIRNKATKKIVKDIYMKHGDILQMKGNFQKEFTHEIPVEKKVTESRISFTFRYHTEPISKRR